LETVRVRVWLEIDEERLAENFRVLQEAVAGNGAGGAGAPTAVLAVVKANAYGHGLEVCAAVLARAGAEWLGVTDAEEGVQVRAALGAAGIAVERQPRVLVMSGMMGMEGEAELVVRYGLTPVVWERGQVERLAGAVRTSSVRAAGARPVGVHLEIDTGMARQGVAAGGELAAVLEVLRGAAAEVTLEGVFTHFASTEVAHSEQTRAQQRRFGEAMAQVRKAGFAPEWVHVGNSSYIDNGAEGGAEGGSLEWVRRVAAVDSLGFRAGSSEPRAGSSEVQGGSLRPRAMVRAGLGLYGYLLPIEGDAADAAAERVGGAVRPVMQWKTRVTGVREVEAGATVGYNGTFVAERRMRLALLPVGYADGLRRELSATNGRAGGWVRVRGEKAAVVGRVSMNLTVVDVTEIAGVAVGDEALLLGDGVTAEDHARLAGTIAYEILCGVRPARAAVTS
jgi:alanine racemase